MIDNTISYLDEIALQIRKFESGRQAIKPSTQTQFKVEVIYVYIVIVTTYLADFTVECDCSYAG